MTEADWRDALARFLPRRGRGRPPSAPGTRWRDRCRPVTFNLELTEVAQLDALAEEMRTTRAEMLARIARAFLAEAR